jgi:hypothetical protein
MKNPSCGIALLAVQGNLYARLRPRPRGGLCVVWISNYQLLHKQNGMNRKVIIGAVVLLVIVVGAGGGYYWWTGTPQYSLLQLKSAIDRGDQTTALSYFDSDAIFNTLWSQVETQMTAEVSQASQSGGSLGTLGAMFAQGLIESIKPEVQQKFIASLDTGIMSTSSTATATTTAGVGSLLANKVTISVSGGIATVSLGNGIGLTMDHTSHSHWTIVAISGLLNPSNFVPSSASATSVPASLSAASSAAPASQAPNTNAKFGVKTEVVSLSGQDYKVSLTVDAPQLYQSTDQYTLPQTGDEFVTVLVRYDNSSSGPISYSDMGFSLVDAQSDRYQPYIVGRDPQLGTGAILNSGQSAQGYITFEAPVGTAVDSLKVHYETPDGAASLDFSS